MEVAARKNLDDAVCSNCYGLISRNRSQSSGSITLFKVHFQIYSTYSRITIRVSLFTDIFNLC
jgi:hypothetical protein